MNLGLPYSRKIIWSKNGIHFTASLATYREVFNSLDEFRALHCIAARVLPAARRM
jgi:hypothetical protein